MDGKAQDALQLSDIEKEYNVYKSLYKEIIRLNDPENIDEVVEKDKQLLSKITELQGKAKDLNEAEKTAEMLDCLTEFSRQSNNHISSLVIKSNEKTIKASKRGFVDQLAVFSIVLTVLTFILDIANVFSMENSNFFSVMASVTSFILMATVMFSLIYIFLHLDDRHESTKRTWGLYIFMAISIVALCYTTCWLSNQANEVFASKSCECETCLRVEEQITAEPTISPTANPTLATANVVTSKPDQSIVREQQ